jgi:hypothetical protein
MTRACQDCQQEKPDIAQRYQETRKRDDTKTKEPLNLIRKMLGEPKNPTPYRGYSYKHSPTDFTGLSQLITTE